MPVVAERPDVVGGARIRSSTPMPRRVAVSPGGSRPATFWPASPVRISNSRSKRRSHSVAERDQRACRHQRLCGGVQAATSTLPSSAAAAFATRLRHPAPTRERCANRPHERHPATRRVGRTVRAHAAEPVRRAELATSRWGGTSLRLRRLDVRPVVDLRQAFERRDRRRTRPVEEHEQLSHTQLARVTDLDQSALGGTSALPRQVHELRVLRGEPPRPGRSQSRRSRDDVAARRRSPARVELLAICG